MGGADGGGGVGGGGAGIDGNGGVDGAPVWPNQGASDHATEVWSEWVAPSMPPAPTTWMRPLRFFTISYTRESDGS